MFHKKWLALPVALLAAGTAGAAIGAASEDAAPLGAAQVSELLACQVSLAAVRDNLTGRGYAIESSSDAGLSTQYKMNERDSTRRLLGGLAVERARRYVVTSVGSDAVRFVPRYRETVFATGVLGNRNDKVTEFDVPLTVGNFETLRDMQREVCAPLGQPPRAAGPNAAPPDDDLQVYLRDRCQLADERACRLMKVR